MFFFFFNKLMERSFNASRIRKIQESDLKKYRNRSKSGKARKASSSDSIQQSGKGSQKMKTFITNDLVVPLLFRNLGE
jgi:hypothetical protein